LVPVVQAPVHARLERTQIDAVRRGLELSETETVRPREKAVPVRPEPQDQVQEPRRSPAHTERAQPAERPVDPGLAQRAAPPSLGQLEHDLPVGERTVISSHYGRPPAREVARA